MAKIKQLVDSMNPDEAAAEIAAIMKNLFPLLSEEALLQQTGFENAQLVAQTGFNSSPKTKGTLLRAKRPLVINAAKKIAAIEDSLATYQQFQDSVENDSTEPGEACAT